MLSLYDIDTLMKNTMQERVRIQAQHREIRAEVAKQSAQRRLQREIERFVQTDGDLNVVLNALDHLTPNGGGTNARRSTGTSCCS
jgi:hypothetical protein